MPITIYDLCKCKHPWWEHSDYCGCTHDHCGDTKKGCRCKVNTPKELRKFNLKETISAIENLSFFIPVFLASAVAFWLFSFIHPIIGGFAGVYVFLYLVKLSMSGWF